MTLKTARKRVVTVIESKFVTLVMTLVTMYALFGDDCRLALAPPSSDDVFYGLSTVALVLFTLELCANCFAKDDYIFRFYFWLDLVATLSLIPDIGWVWDEIVGSDGSSTSTGAIRAGRASRASTRAGRIVRIVRLVRLIRIAKLYKHVSEQQQHQAELERPSQIDEPSMVGKKLADLTTRRVILLVLLMLIALTLFNTSTYADEYNEAQELGIAQLHIASFSERAGQASAGIFQHLVDSYLVSASSLMYLGLHGFAQAEVTALLNAVPGFNTADLKTQAQIAYDFRTAEAPTWGFEGCFLPNGTLIDLNVTCSSTAIFNGKPAVQLEAALNIAKTTFVMLVLAAGAFLFTRDAETLVIGPIERMVNIVKRLADDPLGALHQDSHSQSMDNSETALLERTLTKIGNLLQIGFGQAGAEIIGNNMKDGALNPLIEGQKMNGIFGFCDIRQFTDATECLQEKVMVFVNQIGDIVHEATHLYSGAANKNIGDAFLLMWRLPTDMNTVSDANGDNQLVNPLHAKSVAAKESETDTVSMPSSMVLPSGSCTPEVASASCVELEDDNPAVVTLAGLSTAVNFRVAPHVSQMADDSLFAFLKIIVDIEESNRNGELRLYARHPKIKERFPQGYSVKMGFGLHSGWAIEGAIGSKFKIDASYLSPNVNMSARLEAATKQYGVPLLISGTLYSILSPAAQKYCRLIDCVTVKGSALPMELYTFDVVSHVPSIGAASTRTATAVADFAGDPTIAALQDGLPDRFFEVFGKGVQRYISGDWQEAEELLEEADALKPNDGPTATLLRFMGGFEFQAPDGWAGFRELTEK